MHPCTVGNNSNDLDGSQHAAECELYISRMHFHHIQHVCRHVTSMSSEQVSLVQAEPRLLAAHVQGGVVFAYDMGLPEPSQAEQLVWTYPLQEGPRWGLARKWCSLVHAQQDCTRVMDVLRCMQLHNSDRAVCGDRFDGSWASAWLVRLTCTTASKLFSVFACFQFSRVLRLEAR